MGGGMVWVLATGGTACPAGREYSPVSSNASVTGVPVAAGRWSGVPLLDLLDPMAPTLTALERFLERLVERPIGRLFRAPIEPEQLRRRVERSMEEGRRTEGGRTLAPDRFRILLQPDDLAALLRRMPAPEPTLREGAHAYARQRGWLLRERPLVTLHPSTAVARGDIVVTASVSEAGPGAASLAPGASDGRPSLEATAILPLAIGRRRRPGASPATGGRTGASPWSAACSASAGPWTTRSCSPTSASRATTA